MIPPFFILNKSIAFIILSFKVSVTLPLARYRGESVAVLFLMAAFVLAHSNVRHWSHCSLVSNSKLGTKVMLSLLLPISTGTSAI